MLSNWLFWKLWKKWACREGEEINFGGYPVALVIITSEQSSRQSGYSGDILVNGFPMEHTIKVSIQQSVHFRSKIPSALIN